VKNVIYTIKAVSWWWFKAPNNTWEIVPLKSMKEFAYRVKADLIVINEDSIPSLCLPATFTPYQCSNMLKFYVLDHFTNSNYEKMLFLDLDIIVDKKARNVFEECERKGIYMVTQDWKPHIEAFQFFLKNYFDESVTIPLYCGASIFADKHSISSFYEKVPKLGEWFDFLKKYNLHKNPKADNGIEFNEQNLIGLFLYQQNIEVHNLHEIFKTGYFKHLNTPLNEGADIIHFCAPAGKKYLEEMAKSAI